jgi:hypothetical protein
MATSYSGDITDDRGHEGESTMTDALMSAIVGAIVGGVLGGGIGLIGVIVASARSEDSLRRLAREQSQTLATNALTLLQVEVGYNVRLLDDLRTEVLSNVVGEDYEQDCEKRIRFIEATLPTWLHNRWDSLSLELATVLQRNHIGDLTEMYAQLESLATLQNGLAEKQPSINFFSTFREWHKTGPHPQPVGPNVDPVAMAALRFNTDTLELWHKYLQITVHLHASGSKLTDLLNPDTYPRRAEDSHLVGIKAWLRKHFPRITPGIQRIEPPNTTDPPKKQPSDTSS